MLLFNLEKGHKQKQHYLKVRRRNKKKGITERSIRREWKGKKGREKKGREGGEGGRGKEKKGRVERKGRGRKGRELDTRTTEGKEMETEREVGERTK